MNDELIRNRGWWQRNWKWFFPLASVFIIAIVFLFSALTGGSIGNFAQAYADTELYENALEKANSDNQVIEVLGELQPLDKMAILEGEVQYSNKDQSVEMTVRVNGTRGKARMDIAADRINESWNYKKITIRIKNPPEKKQTIVILD